MRACSVSVRTGYRTGGLASWALHLKILGGGAYAASAPPESVPAGDLFIRLYSSLHKLNIWSEENYIPKQIHCLVWGVPFDFGDSLFKPKTTEMYVSNMRTDIHC